jgi:peptidoglycan/LPS O-acetylase OafA/YrhL
MEHNKYPGIAGLRACSVALVIFDHLGFQNDIFRGCENSWFWPVIEFIRDGQIGVNMFFIISGFLITSLLLKEEETYGSISVRDFYVRRTLRIFPAYYFLLLVYVIAQAAGLLWINGESWFTAVTYTKYFNWRMEWYTAHAWSLSIEEHFYLFWPLVFLLGRQARKNFTIAAICIVPFVRIYLNFYPNRYMNELTIFTRIDAIALGCLFAMYRERIISFLSPHWRKMFYGSFILLVLIRYAPALAEKAGLEFIFVPLGTTYGTVANLLIAIIMMYAVFGPKGVSYRLLNSAVMRYLGALSYSVYLWQQVFLYKTNMWINQFPQNLVLIAMAALFSYYVIEKPFLRLKSQFKGKYARVPVPQLIEVEADGLENPPVGKVGFR